MRQRNLNLVHTTMLILEKTRIYWKILSEPWICMPVLLLSQKYLLQVGEFVELSIMLPLGFLVLSEF